MTDIFIENEFFIRDEKFKMKRLREELETLKRDQGQLDTEIKELYNKRDKIVEDVCGQLDIEIKELSAKRSKIFRDIDNIKMISEKTLVTELFGKILYIDEEWDKWSEASKGYGPIRYRIKSKNSKAFWFLAVTYNGGIKLAIPNKDGRYVDSESFYVNFKSPTQDKISKFIHEQEQMISEGDSLKKKYMVRLAEVAEVCGCNTDVFVGNLSEFAKLRKLPHTEIYLPKKKVVTVDIEKWD